MGFFKDKLLFWRDGGSKAPAEAAPAAVDERADAEELPCRPPNVASWVPAQATREDPREVKARIMAMRKVVFRQMVVDAGRCTACGHCAEVCPDGAITVTDVKVIDHERCSTCGCCVSTCPNQAIRIEERSEESS
jgi:ferredoxin